MRLIHKKKAGGQHFQIIYKTFFSLKDGAEQVYFSEMYMYVCRFPFNNLIRINLPLFSPVLPSNSCCFGPVGLSLLIQHFQQILWVLKLLLCDESNLNTHKTC